MKVRQRVAAWGPATRYACLQRCCLRAERVACASPRLDKFDSFCQIVRVRAFGVDRERRWCWCRDQTVPIKWSSPWSLS